MCKVYNSVGCLTAIKSHLLRHNINEFKSLEELIDFQKSYTVVRREITSDHSRLIELEKKTLSEEIEQLKILIQAKKNEVEQNLRLKLENLNRVLDNLPSTYTGIFQELFGELKKTGTRIKIRFYEVRFNSIIRNAVRRPTNLLFDKNNRYQYIISHFSEAVAESGFAELQELERKKRIIDEVTNLIYGALGEQKAVSEMEKLSDDYILINDFTCSFSRPIYSGQQRGYIKSIQIDHLLISPAGVFLIETKNWSEQSLNNISLRSPVEQINRTNYALFKILAGKNSIPNVILNRHHWGDRKIPIRNLIVLINLKPSEEFQYVKILTLKELVGYVKYFKPSLSNNETEKLAYYLLTLNGKSV